MRRKRTQPRARPPAAAFAILRVPAGSPAARARPARLHARRARHRAGDVITAIDGEKVASADDVLTVLERLQPGGAAGLTLWRSGERGVSGRRWRRRRNKGRPSRAFTGTADLPQQLRWSDSRRAPAPRCAGSAVSPSRVDGLEHPSAAPPPKPLGIERRLQRDQLAARRQLRIARPPRPALAAPPATRCASRPTPSA